MKARKRTVNRQTANPEGPRFESWCQRVRETLRDEFKWSAEDLDTVTNEDLCDYWTYRKSDGRPYTARGAAWNIDRVSIWMGDVLDTLADRFGTHEVENLPEDRLEAMFKSMSHNFDLAYHVEAARAVAEEFEMQAPDPESRTHDTDGRGDDLRQSDEREPEVKTQTLDFIAGKTVVEHASHGKGRVTEVYDTQVEVEFADGVILDINKANAKMRVLGTVDELARA